MTGLTLDTPRACAALAELAYRDAPGPALLALGFTWSAPYKARSQAAVLAGDGRRVFLAFRGTDDLADALIDGHYTKDDFAVGLGGVVGRVHAGFFGAWREIWPIVRRDLASLDPTLPRVYCGHSLGAALAVLSSAAWAPEQAHVFGCPRVGNGAFAGRLAGVDLVRYETWADPVTFVPPRTSPAQMIESISEGRMPSLYRHAGRRVRLPGRGHAMAGYRAALDEFLAQEARKGLAG